MRTALISVVVFLAMAFPKIGLSQISFSLLPDSVFASKPKTNFVMYNYAQFQNLTDDTLAMRWVRTFVQVGDNGPNTNLGDWTIGVQDPTAWHNPANAVDSADFFLPPVTGAFDKLILQLYPHGVAGHLVVHFKVFPIANLADSALIVYDFHSTEIVNGSSEVLSVPNALSLFPNPASDWLNLTNRSDKPLQIRLLSPLGQTWQTLQLQAGASLQLDISAWPTGLWWVSAGNEDGGCAQAFLLRGE